MAEAKAKQEWSHTSALMALIANVNRDPKKTRPFKPQDFNPFANRSKPKLPDKGGFALLKKVFVDRGKPKCQ